MTEAEQMIINFTREGIQGIIRDCNRKISIAATYGRSDACARHHHTKAVAEEALTLNPKRLVASGKASQGTITMKAPARMMEQCPNPSCGDLQDPIDTSIEQNYTVIDYYQCGNCNASWECYSVSEQPNATIAGGDSDGNIYTSSPEVQS